MFLNIKASHIFSMQNYLRLCSIECYPSLCVCSLKRNSSRNYYSHNVKEILVPLPYGNIAAKAWGKETAQPVLAFHGWLDNCGTFDKLMPLLSDKFYTVAIDAPGHGLSSHRPPGCFYTDINLIMDIKKVADFLAWKKFHIIGHSLGGALALMFVSIFPDLVEKLVVLDIVKPTSRAVNLFPGETIKAINAHFKNELQLLRPPPLYTKETAAKRLKEGMHDEITLESAHILIKRGTQPSKCGKGLIFSRDLRCRTIEPFSRRSHEFVEQFMSAVRCEMLMIMANNTNPHYQTATPEVIDRFIDIYKKNCKKFVFKKVDGNHFVHLNNPEHVAPFMNEFLLSTN